MEPRLATLGLDQTDDVAGRPLGFEFGVDGGVEGDHAHVTGEGATVVGVAGAQDELVFAGIRVFWFASKPACVCTPTAVSIICGVPIVAEKGVVPGSLDVATPIAVAKAAVAPAVVVRSAPEIAALICA